MLQVLYLTVNSVMQKFSAKIYKLGINPCVDVPASISRAVAKRGFIPVIGKLNGLPIRANLVPVGNNRHRLFINGEMRKAAGVDDGDLVHLNLEVDTQPRTIPMPAGFALALKQNGSAKIAFGKLTPSRQKEILAYLN